MSFDDKKGIVIASGFKLQAETMLDARQQVDTIRERDELVTIKAATPGLRVYVKNEKKSYVYNGTGWDELTTGAKYTHPTGDGYHHVPATGTTNNGKFLKAGSAAGSESWQNIKTSDIIDFPTSLPTKNNMVVKFNGGAQEGTNMFTFNGSVAKTVNITPAAIGAATSNHTHSPASIGAAPASHDHTSEDITDFDDAVEALLPTIPTKLPNPQGLIISLNGTSQGAYDGSSAKNINITPASIGASESGHTHNYAGSSSAGGAANSVKTSLVIKLNGGSTEGTNMFTFNGATAKSINITPSAIGAAAASHGTHVTYGSDAPKANGTASAGSAASVSRSDHVHPAQTSVSGNAGTATKLATARTIDGVSFDGSANRTHYGTCSTAAGTAAKTVSLTGFALAAGAIVTVKFTATNTAANPTLNVNNTGAKAIMYRGSAISAGYLAANRVYTFVYDGTNYELIGDINTDTNTTYNTGTATTPGLTKLYTGTGSNTDGTMTQDAITDSLTGKAPSSHTHNYAGSSSAVGAAN